MKKIFKRISAAVIALAVMLTVVVFDVPEKLIAAAAGETAQAEHTNHKVCVGATCDNCSHPEITDWQPISNETELKAMADGKHYYLTADISLTAGVKIRSDITLCLNGHTIKPPTGSSGLVSDYIFEIGAYGYNPCALTLCDCSTNKTGALIGGRELYSCVSIYNDDFTFNMFSGTIRDSQSGGVNVKGTFNMHGGMITNNTSSFDGGGVSVMSGTFNMYGGEISGNTARDGGCVYIGVDGKFTMRGGKISGNTATENGGGVCFDDNSSMFTMQGGEISGNTATGNGGGIYISDRAMGTPMLTNAAVTGNKSGTGDAQTNNDIYLGTDKKFYISSLSTDSPIYIATATEPTVDTPVDIARSVSTDISGSFKASKDGQKIVYDANNKKLQLTVAPHSHGFCGDPDCTDSSHPDGHNTEINWTGISDASGFDSLTDGGHYFLTAPVTLTDQVKITSNITLCLNGQTLTAASGKRIFDVNGALTLCDCKGSGKLTGSSFSGNGGGVYVENSKTFIMYGGTISDNAAKAGGGVYVENYGTFTMYGGTISNNTTTSYGSGVYLSRGTFIMNGGAISNNTATNRGGGVYDGYGTFTMNDGTISGNTATASGGGVYVDTTGTFTMTGGTISDNKTEDGGGVFVSSSDTFTMNGGAISGNSATNYGGGAYVSRTFEMNGGTISDNTATNYGGGVYVVGTFTMDDSTISGNTANNGGGVYVSGTFTMDYGVISGNTATTNGGGVYYNYGEFTMNGGEISGNNASSGGGVYNKDDTVTLNGKVDITGNKSNNTANNVYLCTGKTLAIGVDFSTDSKIGVTTEKAPTNCSTGTVAVTGALSSDISGSFSADKEGQAVVYKDNTVHLALHTYSENWSSDGINHWRGCTSCDDITDKAAHSGGTATCQTQAACSVCGQKYGSVAAHSYSASWITDANQHWHACLNSGCTEKSNTADHDFVQKSDGTNHWQECSVCEYKKDETPHSWGNWTLTTTEPTLNTTGTAERTCDCGEKQTKTDVPALIDTMVWAKGNRTDPTLNGAGSEEYTSTDYGDVTITIPKLTDTTVWTKGDRTDPTLDGTGSEKYTSTDYGDVTITIPKLTDPIWAKDKSQCVTPTEEAEGKDVYTSVYGEVTVPLDKLPHSLTHVPEVPATETTAGTKEHWHCEGCGKDFVDEDGTTEITDLTIPVIGHTHTLTHVPEVPATETAAGTKEHWHCDGCGKNFADESGTTEMTDTDLTIPVIGHKHTLIHVPEVPATETTVGTKEHWHCDSCGKNFADENGTTEITDTELTIPVIGHTHTLTRVPEVPATDTTTGVKEHWHCSGCGKNFADEDGTQEVTADDLKIGKVEVQAPVNVEIATSKEDLIAAALTENEQQEVVKGTDIKIILKVENATENIPAEDKGKVETEINRLSDYKLGQYLNVTLMKKIGDAQEQKITETNAPIRITFEIPEGLRGKAEYSVIRIHNGTATVLPDLDSAPNTVTIETDKFSTYALIYQENATPSNPSDSDNSDSTSSESKPSDSDNSNFASSESKPNESDNSNTTSSSDSDLPSTDITHSGGEESGSSEGNTGKHDDNPSTGVTVSLIPLTAALAAVTVATKRKKK